MNWKTLSHLGNALGSSYFGEVRVGIPYVGNVVETMRLLFVYRARLTPEK